MPATVLLDVVEGSEVDEGVQGSTLKRVAYVYHLDSGFSAGDPSAMLRALAASGMPQLFDIHPSNASYFCNRRVVRPETDSSCYVDLYYFQGRIQGSTWLMTEDTTTIPDTTQIHLGTGKQLLLSLDMGTGPSALTKPDVATLSFPRVARRIRFEGSVIGFNIPYVSGSPPLTLNGAPGTQVATKDLYTAAVNSVNSLPWHGKGVGFWWFNDWSVSTPDRGASNTIRASFLSKGDVDWSQYAVLRDTNMQKFIAVNPDAINTLKSQPYVYDVSYAQIAGKNTGILKAGMFPLANFIPLFGN